MLVNVELHQWVMLFMFTICVALSVMLGFISLIYTGLIRITRTQEKKEKYQRKLYWSHKLIIFFCGCGVLFLGAYGLLVWVEGQPNLFK